PGRGDDAHGPAPDHLLGDPAQLPAAPARPGRARRAGPGLAGRATRPARPARGWPGPGPRARDGDGRMTPPAGPRFPTTLGASDPDTIPLLGQNLATDLMGKVGFGELALWLVTQRRPTTSQVRVFEAVLVALADHGFTPTAIAARLTYLSAPDPVHGALPAGPLGGGARCLG